MNLKQLKEQIDELLEAGVSGDTPIPPIRLKKKAILEQHKRKLDATKEGKEVK